MSEPVPVIDLRDVRRSFVEAGRPRAGLDGGSCPIAPGERVALPGRTGSRRSPLLNLADWLSPPSPGDALP